jgi:hypothetical protein
MQRRLAQIDERIARYLSQFDSADQRRQSPAWPDQLIDKDIDCPNRIILGQIVFQPLGKQSALTAVIANDKTRYRILRPNRWRSYH